MANRAMPAMFLRDRKRRSSSKHRLQLHAPLACGRQKVRWSPTLARVEAPLPRDTPWLEGLVGIKEDRDRAFIRQLHRHHSLKDAGGHGDAELAQSVTEYLVKSSRLLRRSGRDETRSPAAARVAIQRELRYHQRRAFHVEKRAVHLFVFVLENAQVGGFFRERRGDRRRVFASDTQKNHQAVRYFSADGVVDGDFGAADALDYGSHAIRDRNGILRNSAPKRGGYRGIWRAAIANALRAARASRVCAATFREAAQRCRRRRQGLERLRRGRPTSRGRACRSASDGPSHSWRLPGCTTRPARLRRRRERGHYHPRCASSVRRGRSTCRRPAGKARGPWFHASRNCASGRWSELCRCPCRARGCRRFFPFPPCERRRRRGSRLAPALLR